MNIIMGRPEVNKIVGMTISEAILHLDKYNLILRTTVYNGKSLMVSGDIDMNRVNVFVENNIIVDIDKLG